MEVVLKKWLMVHSYTLYAVRLTSHSRICMGFNCSIEILCRNLIYKRLLLADEELRGTLECQYVAMKYLADNVQCRYIWERSKYRPNLVRRTTFHDRRNRTNGRRIPVRWLLYRLTGDSIERNWVYFERRRYVLNTGTMKNSSPIVGPTGTVPRPARGQSIRDPETRLYPQTPGVRVPVRSYTNSRPIYSEAIINIIIIID